MTVIHSSGFKIEIDSNFLKHRNGILPSILSWFEYSQQVCRINPVQLSVAFYIETSIVGKGGHTPLF